MSRGFTRVNFAGQNSNGFSLLEIVLGAGIALIIGTLLVGILINNSGFLYKQNALVSEGLSLNDAMQEVDKFVRQAVAVEASLIKDSVTYTADADTLILRLPALSGEEVAEDTYDFAVIEKDPLQSKVLRLRLFPDPASTRPALNKVLTAALDTIQFSYRDRAGTVVAPVSAQEVSTILTVNPKTGSIGSSRSSTIMTTLRNSSQ